MNQEAPAAAGKEAGVLNAEDWRGPNSRSAPRPAPAKRASKANDGFFLNSSRGSFGEECDRARQVVALARDAVEEAFSDIRFGRRLRTIALKPIVSAIAASVERNPLALPSVTRIKERHEYTYLHSVSVCGLMIGLAQELELEPRLTSEIGLAGLLHDVGKAAIPVELLDKPGPLDLDEYALVQEHTTRGYELLRASSIGSEIALDVCLHHHEKIDGTGYPTGISAETMSIFARIGAVCDVYDAVTSTRSYKKRWSPGQAIEWMGSTQGHFDRRVLHAFRTMLGAFPIGSLVRLQSNRLAVVLNAPADAPFTPDVCIFLCGDNQRELPPQRISSRDDPILGLEAPANWRLPDWDSRRDDLLAAYAGE